MIRWLLGGSLALVLFLALIALSGTADSSNPSRRAGLDDFKDDGKGLPSSAQMEKLAGSDPVAFLEYCLRRYQREVTGYRLTLAKQERLGEKLHKQEVIDVCFKDEPHSVFMRWREGARLASRALYVEGENKSGDRSMTVIKPAGIAGLLKSVQRDPEGKDVRNSGRYPITEFGLKKGLQRTLKSWKTGREQKALHVEYLGVKKVEALGGRSCHVLKRTRYKEPEGDDRVAEQTIYIDAETWLLTGTLLRNADDELVASYWFRDVELNPKFAEDQFSKKRVEERN